MAHVLVLSPPTAIMRVFYGIDQAIGSGRPNRPDDVMLVQFFLRSISRTEEPKTKESYFPPGQAAIDVDGIYGPQTAAYLKHFEAVYWRAEGVTAQKWQQDGVVDPKPPGQNYGPVHGQTYVIIRLNTVHAFSFGIDSHSAIDKSPYFPAALRPKLFISR